MSTGTRAHPVDLEQLTTIDVGRVASVRGVTDNGQRTVTGRLQALTLSHGDVVEATLLVLGEEAGTRDPVVVLRAPA